MLEILALWFLTKRIGSIVESTGQKSGWHKALTIVLWLGGETIGALIGATVAPNTIFIYLFALIGAAAGGGIAYLIVPKMDEATIKFILGVIAVYAIVQALISLNLLNAYWQTLLRYGCIMTIVSLGLNLIYGFNGQFSLGQWGFYAIGAYAAADVTYRWANPAGSVDPNYPTSSLTVLVIGVTLAAVAFWLVGKLLKVWSNLDTLSVFALYLAGTLVAGLIAVYLGQLLNPPVVALLKALPLGVSNTVVYMLAVLAAAVFAAEISFLFGLPVLTLGSDYFGIATLGFTIVIKVLLDNTDTLLGFPEMKGARGMVGIPLQTNWFWAFLGLFIVVLVMRNVLHSSVGRAILSVREDEVAAKAMGIDIARYKTLSFVMGSFFAGLAGGLYAHHIGFLHPDTFNFLRSFDPMIIIVFGGLGSVTGTIFASFAWALTLEGLLRLVLPRGFETWRYVVYPAALIILMLLRPQGLLGGVEWGFLKARLPALRKTESSSLKQGESV